jgi:mono/diheme cytochrome c family protein
MPILARGADLGQQVHELFERRCADCHGHKSETEREDPLLDPSTDLSLLRNNTDYVISGHAKDSTLFQRVTRAPNAKGRMPKSTAEDPRDPLSAEEISILRSWIEEPAASHRTFIADEQVFRLVNQDLQTLPDTDRPFYRYLTLHNLYNAGANDPRDSDNSLDIYRAAIGKLVNSLSSQNKITRPVAIDSDRLVFRVDLRCYGWTAATWEKVASAYPYDIRHGLRVEREIREWTGSKQAVIRADWFTFVASQPPLYYDFLNLPKRDAELESSLGLNVIENLGNGAAQRAGFAQSGVSDFNRVIERHPITTGAYWKSYDFRGSDGAQDIYRRPLGPKATGSRLAFEQAGGEIIFSLPNGLQAYLLVKADGAVINRAPTDIVKDATRKDVAIIDGISCIKCHAEGMNLNPRGNLDDEVKAAASKDVTLTADEKQLIALLYPAADAFRALHEQDSARFKAALRETGATTYPEPIAFLYYRFRADITDGTFASEIGYEKNDIKQRLLDSDDESLRSMGLRLEQVGLFPRKSFLEQFREVVTGLKLGDPAPSELLPNEDFFPDGTGSKLTLADRNRLLAKESVRSGDVLRFASGRQASGDASSGINGSDGAAGGSSTESVVPGDSGKDGENGLSGGRGHDGMSAARDIQVKIAEQKVDGAASIAKIEIHSSFGNRTAYYDFSSPIVFAFRGSNGTSGADGGNGGRGGRGGNGGDGEDRTGEFGNPAAEYGGDGGDGGDGGNGGNGGAGGRGGDGGNVDVQIIGTASFCADVHRLVSFDVKGGTRGFGGSGGKGGAAGRAGSGGSGGNHGGAGKRGKNGTSGSDGERGADGLPGHDGKVKITESVTG